MRQQCECSWCLNLRPRLVEFNFVYRDGREERRPVEVTPVMDPHFRLVVPRYWRLLEHSPLSILNHAALATERTFERLEVALSRDNTRFEFYEMS